MLDTLDELTPLLLDMPVSYASADDLLTASDLIECNVTIKRWHKNGKPLTIRVRALDLDQQDQIGHASLKKNARSGVWEQNTAAFCAATLQAGVIVPTLSEAQAQAMRKKNPLVIRKLTDFIWLLAGLDDETIERAARALMATQTDPAAAATPSAEDREKDE